MDLRKAVGISGLVLALNGCAKTEDVKVNSLEVFNQQPIYVQNYHDKNKDFLAVAMGNAINDFVLCRTEDNVSKDALAKAEELIRKEIDEGKNIELYGKYKGAIFYFNKVKGDYEVDLK